MDKINIDLKKKWLITGAVAAGLLILLVFLFSHGKKEEIGSLYLDDIPAGYQVQDQVSYVRYSIPEDVYEKMINLNSISVDSETLKETIQTTYVCRDENYGTMMVGPDLMLLAARDKELISMDLRSVTHGEELRYILQNEVKVDGDIRVNDHIEKTEDTAETIKLIAPITLKDLSFSSIKLEDSYSGYVAMIQSQDSVSGIFFVVYPDDLSSSEKDVQKEVCKTVAQSFQVDTSYSDYSTYGNVLPEFSYEPGGLFNYSGYTYENLGTPALSSAGTYNQIDSMVGMYCLNTQFGPINMPFILDDAKLTSTVVEKENELDAKIHSETDKLKFDIHTKSIGEKQSFDDIMSDLRGKIQADYSYFLNIRNFTKKSVLSEQVDEDSGAVITVCGWDETTGEMAVVYYKLEVSKDIYTITRIENNQKVTDDPDPMLSRLVELSGIVIVVV